LAKGDLPDITEYDSKGNVTAIIKGDGTVITDPDTLALYGGFDHTTPFEVETAYYGRFR
jgi:hypothetical protein